MTAAPATRLRSIGEVIGELKTDFPDLAQSKLRFLESEGLIHPQRTPNGYRKYSESDVARIRFILTLQRDQYLPLKVIRQRVDSLGVGSSAAPMGESDWEEVAGDSPAQSEAPVGAGAHPDDVVRPLRLAGAEERVRPHEGHDDGDVDGLVALSRAQMDFFSPGGLRVSITHEELIESTGLAEASLRELTEFGLIRREASGLYAEDSIIVATVAARLTKYGLGARHLRGFRYSADREAGTVKTAIATLRDNRTPEAAEQREGAMEDLAQSFALLQVALLRSELKSL